MIERARGPLSVKRRQGVTYLISACPEWSDSRLALALAVERPTMRQIRRELEASGHIPRLRTRKCIDGVIYTLPR